MDELKIVLFENISEALENYRKVSSNLEDSHEERRVFCALYKVLEDARLEEEYNLWKYGK